MHDVTEGLAPMIAMNRKAELQARLAPPLARAGLPPPQPAADPQADAFAPLLQAAAAPPHGTAPAPLRRRLLQRVACSAAASRKLHTRRLADTVPLEGGAGVTLRPLYEASAGRPRRSGEPGTVTLVELAPGARWAGPAAGSQREWLVLRGHLQIGSVELGPHDYHIVPAGTEAGAWHSVGGAWLYQREAAPEAGAPSQPWTQRADSAEWADYAPGIKRRLMWQQGDQAAMLYHAEPGAAVPHHGHRHDEECLMLAGDFFLDEVLLRSLDYQIAPAGTEHRTSSTDTGVLLYAHGDLALDLR